MLRPPLCAVDRARVVVTPRVFLTGEWRYLAMLNYRVDAALLEPFVPHGTTLDDWQGTTYVSLVGFLFRDTRVLGVPIPLHRDFEEVNLRFYVRREADGEVRRGVTFIKEIVPRPAIATVARLAYNEPYVALPMRHSIAARPFVNLSDYTVRGVFDTMPRWWLGARRHVSLDDIAWALGFESSKTSEVEGSRVFDLYQAGKLGKIREYNLNDVRLTRKVYERMVASFGRS